MSVNIRYPNITGGTEREQLSQVKSYLHQLVEQLNYALPTIGTGDGSTQSAASDTHEVQGGELSYYELKSLIVHELQQIDAEVAKAVDEALEKAIENGEFNGVSPTVSVTEIDGGHRVTITDVNGTTSFDVMDGEAGSGGGTSGDYLPLEGGTMQGDIEMDGRCIYFGPSDENIPYITGASDADGMPYLEILGRDNDDPIRIGAIADPVNDRDAVPKTYVDNFAADRIVEQGTSGIWTYRKWNSGKIEMWTNSHQFPVSFTKSSIGVYYATQSGIAVPLVKTIEFASGDCTKWHYVNWASVTCNGGTELGIRYYGLNGNGDGGTIPFSMYVIGTWK